jgi:hypothetical protein
MIKLTKSTPTENIANLKEIAQDFLIAQRENDYFGIYSLLAPEGNAIFTGLKKLIEKDYAFQNEPQFISIPLC